MWAKDFSKCRKKVDKFKCYNLQFKEMRECVKKYGNFPYPKYMILDDKKLIYLEIPKVANCSIKGSMLNQKFPDDYSVQKEALKFTENTLKKKYNEYYKFTFVRNPFERLVSCYESKYHNDKKLVGIVMNELVYENYLFGYLSKDRGFTNFVCRIALIPDKYKDHHFKPQSSMVYDEKGNSYVNYIGRFEHLSKQYSKIISRFGLGELPCYNKTKHKNYMDYYNAFTARLAYFIYKKDIEKFGYMNEYRQLLYYVSKNGDFFSRVCRRMKNVRRFKRRKYKK